MEEQQPEQGGGQPTEQYERERQWPEPRIYIASLSDYNAGRLHGVWLSAAQEPEELGEAVQAMLAASPEPGAEEFAIHDYEHFGPLHLNEYESLDSVSIIAKGIATHGPTFADWAAIVGTDVPEALSHFEDAYMGHYESLTDYGEDIIEAFGLRAELDEGIPELLIGYVNIDVAAFPGTLNCPGKS